MSNIPVKRGKREHAAPKNIFIEKCQILTQCTFFLCVSIEVVSKLVIFGNHMKSGLFEVPSEPPRYAI